MWTCTATSFRNGRPASDANSSRAGVDGDAELVDLQPGRDVRMALRVDIGIDAHGDPRRASEALGDRLDPRQLAGRLDVDRFEPERHRAFELALDLPTPVNTMSCGSNPARRATSISQIEFASAALPRPCSSAAIANVELAFKA